MTKKLKYLQNKKQKQKQEYEEQQTQAISEAPTRDPDSLYFEHFDATKKGPEKKHNGVYVSLEMKKYWVVIVIILLDGNGGWYKSLVMLQLC